MAINLILLFYLLFLVSNFRETSKSYSLRPIQSIAFAFLSCPIQSVHFPILKKINTPKSVDPTIFHTLHLLNYHAEKKGDALNGIEGVCDTRELQIIIRLMLCALYLLNRLKYLLIGILVVVLFQAN